MLGWESHCVCVFVIWSPVIDSEELIQPAYTAWRAGTSNRNVVLAHLAWYRFLGSLKGLINSGSVVMIHKAATPKTGK
jgi:hypothetical protein